MSTPIRSSALANRIAVTTLALLAGAMPTAPLFAQYSPIGLSSIRAQRFDNEDLLFFEPEPADHFAYALAAGDFNGDGADDLATGIPDDDGIAGSGCTDCGIVVVRYGVPGLGLESGVTSTVLYQGFGGNPTSPEESEKFGYALAAGDFNGDSFDDLAVGIPAERDPGHSNTPIGAVQIHYGSLVGLQLQNIQWIHRFYAWEFAPTTCPGAADEFGAALAAGNFDGDLFDDLAIGSPRSCARDSDGPWDSGGVFVAHGGSGGLLPVAGYFLSEDSVDIFGDAANGERFGAAVAIGDFNGDGYGDLSVGVPAEGDNGAVYVVFGSPFGLIYASSIFWAPGALGIEPEAGARLGSSLATGDFDGDGFDDLCVGDPKQDLGLAGEIPDAGLVAFAFGSSTGFDLSRTVHLSDPEGSEAGDHFGWALGVGDFDRDGRDDLAAGAPFEDAGGTNIGTVSIAMGESGSGVGSRSRTILPGFFGIPGGAQSHQDFGRALVAGDFDGDSHADLAIGAPWYDITAIGSDVGLEIVLYGSLFADGFEAGGVQYWSESTP